MPAEIAQHHIQRQICADGDGVGAHQTARNVIRKAQHFLKALTVLLIHDGQHLTRHLIGQLMEDVGDIVVVQLLDKFGQCLRLPVSQRGVAEFVWQFVDDQHLLLRFEEAQKHRAVVRG